MREYKWTPSIIDDLFFDDIDYHGIIWLYNDIAAVEQETQQRMKPKK